MTGPVKDDFEPKNIEMVIVETTVDDFPKEVIFGDDKETEARIMEEAARKLAERQIPMTFISSRYLKPSFQILKKNPADPEILSVFGRVEIYYIPKGNEEDE